MTSHDHGHTTRPTAIGRTIWNRGLLLGILVLVLWFGASTVTTIVQSEGAGSATDRAVQIAIMGAIYFAIWWRTAMVRVRVSQDGLVVRNVWRTHRIAWEDIRGFEPQRQGWLLHRTAAVLQDGTWVPLAAITLYRDASSGWGVVQTELLNAERLAALHGRSIDDAAETVAASAHERPPAPPAWARVVLPIVVLVVGVPLLAPQLPAVVAALAAAVLIGGALMVWRALGGRVDRRAAPLLTAAGLVVVLRILLEVGLRSG
ncbi:PH domain-containing protein [Nitriliruptor alkaliphilus]|uniref:PH domain-containing protein n=1 Tax=Nitriliruptor alkaliphilus TaxID=427918 RepID=UPI000696FD9A|nr:PH domain-containing protein [Nitriliruptor alkaliphilus]